MIENIKDISIVLPTADGGEKEITLKSHAWGVFEAMSHMPKIGRVFAQPIAIMLSQEQDVNEVLPLALAMFFDELEATEVEELFKLITKDVYYGSQKADLENLCAGDLSNLFYVVAETLMHNYGSLFSGKGFGRLFATMEGMSKVAQVTKEQ